MDLTGQRFTRLVVLGFAEVRNGNSHWTCRCDCGEMRVVAGCGLRSGKSISCGCYSRDRIASLRRTHGLSNTPEHRVWAGMRKRCLNPLTKRFADYGGRGITICERWDDFEVFLKDMGPRPSPKYTIERKDNDGPYAPWNCEWVLKAEQAKNRRNCIYVEDNGERITVAEYARRHSLNPFNLYSRIRHWGSLERALSAPYRRRSRQPKSHEPQNSTAVS
jgi:hypothetical protein